MSEMPKEESPAGAEPTSAVEASQPSMMPVAHEGVASPQGYKVRASARAARSHSASVGRRMPFHPQ